MAKLRTIIQPTRVAQRILIVRRRPVHKSSKLRLFAKWSQKRLQPPMTRQSVF